MLYLSTKNLINPDRYLIKDGSLQYAPSRSSNFKELIKIKSHYKCVIGVSKMFDPELCQRQIITKVMLIKLQYCQYITEHQPINTKVKELEMFFFAVWYVRIRESNCTASPFSGVVKIEKILITEEEIENGLDSEEIDLITANIINERNPVCYGKDARWANHLVSRLPN